MNKEDGEVGLELEGQQIIERAGDLGARYVVSMMETSGGIPGSRYARDARSGSREDA